MVESIKKIEKDLDEIVSLIKKTNPIGTYLFGSYRPGLALFVAYMQRIHILPCSLHDWMVNLKGLYWQRRTWVRDA